MESYPFNLMAGAGQSAITIPAQGDMFVYESADTKKRTNLMRNSEGKAQTLATANAVIVAAASFGDFENAIQFVAGVTQSAYREAAVEAGMLYTFSTFIQMDDGGDPAPGASAFSGDFSLNMASGVVIAEVVAVPEFTGMYRVSGKKIAPSTGALKFGVAKLANQSVRGFRVSGFQLEVAGTATSYIPTKDKPVTLTTGDTRVRVKPDTGGEIILRPGQRFRTTQRTTNWNVRMAGNDPVGGTFIIGEGDFDDANTKNTFTLDASFANVVTVANTRASAVPVDIGVTVDAPLPIATAPGTTIPVSIAGIVNTNKGAMAYSKTATAKTNGATPVKLIDAAENVNGMDVLMCSIASLNGQAIVACSIIAKATAPASIYDGDCIASLMLRNTADSQSMRSVEMISVPAGVGIWGLDGAIDGGAMGAMYGLKSVMVKFK